MSCLCLTEEYVPVLFIGSAWGESDVENYFVWKHRLFVKRFWLDNRRCWIFMETQKVSFLVDDPASENNFFLTDWPNTYVFEEQSNGNSAILASLLDIVEQAKGMGYEFSANPQLEAVYQELKAIRSNYG